MLLSCSTSKKGVVNQEYHTLTTKYNVLFNGKEAFAIGKQILDEAKYLVDSGTQELILLGQNVNAYSNENYRLSNLILEIEKFSEIKKEH